MDINTNLFTITDSFSASDCGIIFVNLTPHKLSIKLEDGDVLVIPHGRNDPIARCSQSRVYTRKIGRIELTASSFGDVYGVPEPIEGVVYFVSALVADQLKRSDVIAPGALIRNDEGQPIGADGGSDFYIIL